MGYVVRGLASPHPFLGATRCAVLIVLRLWTIITAQVLAVLRERGDASDSVPRQSAPSSVVLQMRERAVQTVQKPEIPPCSSLTIVYVPTVVRRQVPKMVQIVQKTVKFPLVFLDLVQCPSLFNDRCRMVETVQKTVCSWCCSWTSLLTCPCWPRHGAVEVPQLQFIDWCVSSSWL